MKQKSMIHLNGSFQEKTKNRRIEDGKKITYWRAQEYQRGIR